MPVIPLLVALAVVAPAPPPTTTVPPAIVMPSMARTGRPSVQQTISVQVRQDGHMVWSGDLQRSSTGMASFSQQQRESRACPAGEGATAWNGSSFVNTSLTVSLNSDFATADDAVRVNVERTRPYGDNAACGGEQGTSTVRFTTDAKLTKGKPVTLSGEAGLAITITLR